MLHSTSSHGRSEEPFPLRPTKRTIAVDPCTVLVAGLPPVEVAFVSDGVTSPFALLLNKAKQNGSIAEGFASSFAEFGPKERCELVRAILEDTKASAEECFHLLLRLLATERDESVVRTIRLALRSCTPYSTGQEKDQIWLSGDKNTGTAILRFVFEQPLMQWFALAWNDRKVTWTFSLVLGTALDHKRVLEVVRQWDQGREPSVVGLQWGIDQVCDVLWAHCRNYGALPEGLEGLAAYLLC